MKNYSMNPKDAAKILGLNDNVTPEIVKDAYRRACMKYHPDRNPAGEEMMKAVNAAYDALKDFSGSINIDQTQVNYGSTLNDAINFALNLGLEVELCGTWIFLSGDTKPIKDQIKEWRPEEEQENKFRWSRPKQRWYFRPSDYKSYSRGKYSMDEIREKYGSTTVRKQPANRLTA